jgi:GNAT superfamily N-acetyltransferase
VLPEDDAAVRAHILRVLEEDLHTPFNPVWHWDLDDIGGAYRADPRHALFVATDTAGGEVAGTIALHSRGPGYPPHPPWLVARYSSPRVCQVLRAYVARPHRRRGIGRVLVEALRRFVADLGAYDVIYLHTDTRSPGAEVFWRAMPTVEVYDGWGNSAGFSQALHFELAIPGRPAPRAWVSSRAE